MSKQVIIFVVNEQEFCIDIQDIKEIVQSQELFQVPNSPEFVKGLINLRGKVFTIFNVRKRFGFEEIEINDNSRILILNIEESIGILVDNVTEIRSVESSDIEETPDKIKEIDEEYIREIVKVGEELIIEVDIDRLIQMKSKV